jgi:hypothetical protein
LILPILCGKITKKSSKKNKIWDDLAYYSFVLTIGDSTHAKLMENNYSVLGSALPLLSEIASGSELGTCLTNRTALFPSSL